MENTLKKIEEKARAIFFEGNFGARDMIATTIKAEIDAKNLSCVLHVNNELARVEYTCNKTGEKYLSEEYKYTDGGETAYPLTDDICMHIMVNLCMGRKENRLFS